MTCVRKSCRWKILDFFSTHNSECVWKKNSKNPFRDDFSSTRNFHLQNERGNFSDAISDRCALNFFENFSKKLRNSQKN